MREAAAHDKAAASEAEMREEEMQAAMTKLQKQLDKVRACTCGLSCLPTNKPCLKHMQAFSIPHAGHVISHNHKLRQTVRDTQIISAA